MARKALFIVALIGFGVSLLTHIATFGGINVPRLLPIGLIVLSSPLGFLAYGVRRKEPFGNLFSYLNYVIRNAPHKLRFIAMGLLIYVVINICFSAFILNRAGGPAIIESQPVLESHGSIIERLSWEEYSWHVAYENRWVSAIAMFIYGMFTVERYIESKSPSSSSDLGLNPS